MGELLRGPRPWDLLFRAKHLLSGANRECRAAPPNHWGGFGGVFCLIGFSAGARHHAWATLGS